MKLNYYLAVREGKYCCLVSSFATFDQLEESLDSIDSRFFNFERSTNWCGNDRLERTLQILGIVPTGRKIDLLSEIAFSGVDYDMGHEYKYKTTFNEIWEIEKYPV